MSPIQVWLFYFIFLSSAPPAAAFVVAMTTSLNEWSHRSLVEKNILIGVEERERDVEKLPLRVVPLSCNSYHLKPWKFFTVRFGFGPIVVGGIFGSDFISLGE
ncbi:hypothetical protein TNIN_238421 [Trichonephila inaurata madagascariensis]|uniref:Uncharacterized protein n=1 Tax=Trichonephila inaurata madagascariensis TaxID=2747483 RepID=A0A8X6XWL2_9ARAC|nr:hypothetical protein TNIN_238421 [Trichonephila inaurata madagascariensis]